MELNKNEINEDNLKGLLELMISLMTEEQIQELNRRLVDLPVKVIPQSITISKKYIG